MSSNEVPTREAARHVFAQKFNDAGYTLKESDDERVPVYLLLLTGENANHVLLVGTLTEREDADEDNEYWRGRVVDPTGTFFVYAGQYQPEAASALRDLDASAHVAVVGKSRTYETDDGSIDVSVRPESIIEVDAATRDCWVTGIVNKMLDRIAAFDEEGDEYVWVAHEHCDLDPEECKRAATTTPESLRQADELSM